MEKRESNGKKLSHDWLSLVHKMSAPQTPMSDLWGRFEGHESGEDKGGKRRKESVRTDWGHEETTVWWCVHMKHRLECDCAANVYQ